MRYFPDLLRYFPDLYYGHWNSTIMGRILMEENPEEIAIGIRRGASGLLGSRMWGDSHRESQRATLLRYFPDLYNGHWDSTIIGRILMEENPEEIAIGIRRGAGADS